MIETEKKFIMPIETIPKFGIYQGSLVNVFIATSDIAKLVNNKYDKKKIEIKNAIARRYPRLNYCDGRRYFSHGNCIIYV